MKKTVIKDYGTHSYTDDYIKSNLYCVNCGDREVWIEDSEGDYYVGANHVCISCRAVFHLPDLDTKPNEFTKNVVQQLIDE